jgi:rod shape-determining protein MreC
MSRIRFNHIFFALLALSFLSAFVFDKKTDALRPQFQGLFTWISRPIHQVGSTVSDKLAAQPATDRRSAASLRQENDALRVALVSLEGQLNALRQLNAERELVGPVRSLSIPAAVTGADSAQRDSLLLAATSRDGVREGQPVVYAGGIAGRIDSAGLTGSRVQLVTDIDSRLLATFGRYRRNGDRLEYLRLPLQPQVIRGLGDGTMTVFNLTAKAVQDAGLAVGDWATLADADWPMSLQGYRVGRVTDIRPAKAALFIEVRLQPAGNLMGLREVMVVTK